MTIQDVIETLIRDLQLVPNDVALEPEAPLFKGGPIDSFGAVSLILALEREFQVKIVTSELTLENFNTLGQVAQYMEHVQQRSSA